MSINLKRVVSGLLLFILCLVVQARGGVAVTKEKVGFKAQIPGVIETASKESTFRFIYPTQLNFFNEQKFSKYAVGFCNIDGFVHSSQPQRFIASKVLNDVITDYKFEIITKGLTNLRKEGGPVEISANGRTYGQLFNFNFECSLKIYKKDQLIREFIIDDGSKVYTDLFFQNYALKLAPEVYPAGFPNEASLDENITKNLPEFYKFTYCIEYAQYLKHYERACGLIKDLFGSYELRAAIVVGFVDKDDAANYTEFNAQAMTLFTTLGQTTSFEDFKTQAQTYKNCADYFEKFSNTPDLDKRLKIMTLRDAAIAQIFVGDIGKAYVSIARHDSIASGLAGQLQDYYNIFATQQYMSSYKDGELISYFKLLDVINQKVEDKKAAATAVQQEKYAVKAELDKAVLEERAARNIKDLPTELWYLDGSKASGFCSFIFYQLDAENNVAKSCGRDFTIIDENKEDRVLRASDFSRALVYNKDNTKTSFYVLQIVQTTLQRLSTPFNEVKLCELKTQVGRIQIFVDRTDPIAGTLLIVPTQNNPKLKAYRLRDIIVNNKYPEWLKLNTKISEIVNSGEVTNDLDGAKKLATLINEQNLPVEAL